MSTRAAPSHSLIRSIRRDSDFQHGTYFGLCLAGRSSSLMLPSYIDSLVAPSGHCLGIYQGPLFSPLHCSTRYAMYTYLYVCASPDVYAETSKMSVDAQVSTRWGSSGWLLELYSALAGGCRGILMGWRGMCRSLPIDAAPSGGAAALSIITIVNKLNYLGIYLHC
ncbi:hypothetical protein LI328DRAFT_169736 [Trichoderma asperelloides]|nr:hypothetical protein LI328DRAFT_169736 [Trichoderma asperelloides]